MKRLLIMIFFMLVVLVSSSLAIYQNVRAVDNPTELTQQTQEYQSQPTPIESAAGKDGGQQSGSESIPDKDGLFAKLLGTFLYGINGALDALGFPSIDKIIFDGAISTNNQNQAGNTKDDWTFYVFTKDQMEGGKWSLLGMYKAMQILAWVLMIYQVIILGMKMSQPVRDPAKRINLQTAIGDMFVTAMFIALSWAPFYIFGQLNHMLVSSIGSSGFGPKDLVRDVMDATHSGFMTQLAVLVFHALGLVMLALYFMRMFALGILFVVSPLIAVLWMSRSRRSTVMLWLSEVAGNIFLQSIHALLIAVFLALEHNSANWWEWILFAAALIPIGNLLRQIISSLFGAQGDHGAITTGALVGAGALTGLISIGTRAAGKGITTVSHKSERWVQQRRGENSGGGVIPGEAPTRRYSGSAGSLGLFREAFNPLYRDLADGDDGMKTATGATPAEAAAKGTTGIIGRYSPQALESAKATAYGLKGTRIGGRVAGAVGAAVGGAVGATIGMASSIVPGSKSDVVELTKAGAQLGRAAIGGLGSAVGGAAGMATGAVKGVSQHYSALKEAGQDPQSRKEHVRALRQGLYKALGYDQAPAGIQTLRLAGGFVGSFGGEVGAHVGAAAGHGMGRLIMATNHAFQEWMKANSGGTTLEGPDFKSRH